MKISKTNPYIFVGLNKKEQKKWCSFMKNLFSKKKKKFTEIKIKEKILGAN